MSISSKCLITAAILLLAGDMITGKRARGEKRGEKLIIDVLTWLW